MDTTINPQPGEEQETYRNLGRNPKTVKSIDIITSVEDQHRYTAQSNQCATFYHDDGD